MTDFPPSLARRWFLKQCGVGLGAIALADLLSARSAADAPVAHAPGSVKPPHFPAKAQRVIHLFMAGAPSQLDLFDHKPELARLEGKPLPPSVTGGQRFAFIRSD